MPVDERTRRMMGESLVRIHGEEVADAIMAHLPPVTYGELATKQDVREAVAELRAEMHQGFAEIQKQIAEIQKQIAEIQKQIAGVHKNISRATLALLVGLLGAPLVDELAKRLF
jgi:septal ring factor EnvC (AmiA/AmiB activator)